jgi:hypothetical protein
MSQVGVRRSVYIFALHLRRAVSGCLDKPLYDSFGVGYG